METAQKPYQLKVNLTFQTFTETQTKVSLNPRPYTEAQTNVSNPNFSKICCSSNKSSPDSSLRSCKNIKSRTRSNGTIFLENGQIRGTGMSKILSKTIFQPNSVVVTSTVLLANMHYHCGADPPVRGEYLGKRYDRINPEHINVHFSDVRNV